MKKLTTNMYRFDYYKAERNCDKVLNIYIETFKDDFKNAKHNVEEEAPDFAKDYLSPFG